MDDPLAVTRGSGWRVLAGSRPIRAALPVPPGEPTGQAETSAAEARAADPRPASAGRRVLLVEDNEEDSLLTRRYLGRFDPGWTVETAPTLAALTQRLSGTTTAELPYDVILLDHQLPDGSALDALAHFEALRQSVPVVVVTGRADREHAVELLKAGAADIVFKQAGYLQRLPAAIERAIARHRSALERAQHERDVARLYALTSELALEREPALLARRIVETLVRVYDADGGSLILAPGGSASEAGEQGRHLRVDAPARPADPPAGDAASAPAPLTWPDGLVTEIEQARQPRFVEAAGATPVATPAGPTPVGAGAFAALPLVVGDRPIGVLAIGYRRPRHFSASERQLLTVYAAHAAALLEQVRLLEAARTQAQREALLVELSSVVNATLDVEALARLVVRRLPELVPADRCAFGLYDPASGRLTRRLRRLETGEIDLTPDLMRDVASTGYLAAVRELRSVVDNDLRTLPTEPERQYAAQGIRARIVAPVVVDGVCRAVFGVSSFRSNVYGPDHVRLVEAVAAQLAVALRNADLLAESQAAYRALQETQARLVESEKLRVAGQLASGVAHDQNNVLTVILGHAELALSAAVDPAVRFSLEQIIRAAEGGAATVRRLQEYARIRRDGGLPIEALDLNEVVREAIALASPRWERSNAPRDRRPITVLLDLAPDLPLVAGERYPLHEILINLLFNAVDALPQGGGSRCGPAPRPTDGRSAAPWPTPGSACRPRCWRAASSLSSPPRPRAAPGSVWRSSRALSTAWAVR